MSAYLRIILALAFSAAYLPFGAPSVAMAEGNRLKAELVSVEKIWDEAPHNAFTDLVRWNDRFYCAFREGQGHVGEGGKLRILVSTDGESWESAGLLSHNDFDLRDAALSVMPDKRLMVLGGVQHVVDGERRTGTFVSFSDDGESFSDPQVVVPPGRWLWRVTPMGNAAYGVSYGTPTNQSASALLMTTDGVNYETITDSLFEDGERPTEARIRFAKNGTAYCLHRRDGSTKNSAMLGIASEPYDQWEWHDLKRRLGGPNFIQLPGGEWIASGRLYDGGARTEVLHLDMEAKSMEPLLRLPSGGDTSYPGMVWHDGLLWISYYASHEGRTSIYLAKVRIEEVDDRSPVEINNRRELFIDRFLVDEEKDVTLRLHEPRAEDKVLEFDRDWEGAFCGYATVIKDGDLYRMYYRGLPGAGRDGTDAEVTCYAESVDGIEWYKPNVGVYEVNGSKENNIVLMGETPASHNFSPFLDTNPNAKPEEKFKALGGGAKGLIAFTSPDGVHWNRVQEEPVFTKGIFDSQNVSFWSSSEQCYLCYFRTWTETGYGGYRTVSRTSSDDFINWTEPQAMTFGDTRFEHLYTNQTHPYVHAPHIYIGVAARFMPGRQVITSSEARRIGVNPSYFGDVSDAVLLTSRGSNAYQRTFMESFVRPGIGLENWVSRTNYPALGVIPTGDDQLSIYIQKDYGQPTSHIRRYSLREDGFASYQAGYSGGEFTTRPVIFSIPSEDELEAKRAALEDHSIYDVARKSTASPIVGKCSLDLTAPYLLSLPNTQNLGEQVTFAAHLRNVPGGTHRRIFSAYNGGTTTPNELILDVNSAKDTDARGSIRFMYDSHSVGATIEETGVWSSESGDHEAHHVAVTWNNGIMKLYFDGELIKSAGEDGAGAIELALGDLRFGEDYAPTSLTNEPFLGQVDDVLVLRRALTASEVAELAKHGVEGIANTVDASGGVALTFEHEGQRTVRNIVNSELIFLNAQPGVGDCELYLNMSTSAAGSIRVELQDESGAPIPGYSLADCDDLIGDNTQRVVTWNGQSELSSLAGKPVKLRFVMKDANVFSFQFR